MQSAFLVAYPAVTPPSALPCPPGDCSLHGKDTAHFASDFFCCLCEDEAQASQQWGAAALSGTQREAATGNGVLVTEAGAATAKAGVAEARRGKDRPLPVRRADADMGDQAVAWSGWTSFCKMG